MRFQRKNKCSKSQRKEEITCGVTDRLGDCRKFCRLVAFRRLTKQVELHGDVLSRTLLRQGFEFSWERVPFVAPNGIFTPKRFNYPLSMLCRLRQRKLLDAAHIIPDAEESGTANVDNGISLCKIHHAAFDRFLIGIRPDFKVEVKEKILKEKDGPMLQHGLKELHGSSIIRPRDKAAWPNRDALDYKYNKFVQAV